MSGSKQTSRSINKNITPKTYKCFECKSNITAQRKQGVECISCKKSLHYDCINQLTAEDKNSYSTGEKIFICTSCKPAHEVTRRSISVISDPAPVEHTTNQENNQLERITQLETLVYQLQNSLKDLTDQLRLARGEVTALKETSNSSLQELRDQSRLSGQQVAKLKEILAAKQGIAVVGAARTHQKVFFTVNGIPETSDEDVKSIVEKVLSAKTQNNVFDQTTIVRRLQSKSIAHHSILVEVEQSSPSYQSIVSALGSLQGTDIGLDCGQIFVNRSWPSSTYQLYRKAKILKTKGFEFVWLKDNKVLARKSSGGKVICIKSDSDIQGLSG